MDYGAITVKHVGIYRLRLKPLLQRFSAWSKIMIWWHGGWRQYWG